jgi:hypothetical protein
VLSAVSGKIMGFVQAASKLIARDPGTRPCRGFAFLGHGSAPAMDELMERFGRNDGAATNADSLQFVGSDFGIERCLAQAGCCDGLADRISDLRLAITDCIHDLCPIDPFGLERA